MSKMVNEVFQENYGELVMLVITDVQLDSTSEVSVENQQASKQKAVTATQQQVIDVLLGEISVIQSNYTNQVAMIDANTVATTQIINATANSIGSSKILQAEATGYQLFEKNAGFTSQNVLNYNYYRQMRTDNSSSSLRVFVTPESTVSITSA